MAKVYFNAEGLALGTSEDYFGDYYANEKVRLPPGCNPVGRTLAQLWAEAREISWARCRAALEAFNEGGGTND
jgi:hypothetical protein